MTFRLALFAAGIAAASAILACGSDDDTGISSDPCPTTGLQPCDDDIAVTAPQHDACETAAASSCGASFQAYQLCLNEATKCTSAKMTDSAAQASACESQLATYQACTNAKASSDAGIASASAPDSGG
jgi:hypothetical protein